MSKPSENTENIDETATAALTKAFETWLKKDTPHNTVTQNENHIGFTISLLALIMLLL